MKGCYICGKKIPEEREKYCSKECMEEIKNTEEYKNEQRKKSKEYYYEHRGTEEFDKARTANMKQWYQKNKEKHKKAILENYAKNKERWMIREFARRQRKRILKYLEGPCAICKKNKPIIVSTITYDKKLIPDLRKTPIKKREQAIKEYTKKNIKGICSVKCKGINRWGKK